MTYPGVDSASGTLLVIDPDAYNVELVGALAAAGYAVWAVATANDAWQVLQHRLPDLVLLAVSLPDASGLDWCRHFKADPERTSVPVLFVGAGVDKRDRLQAFAVGGVDFIPRPFWVEEVIARVGVHLSLWQVQHYTRQALAERGHSPLLANLQQTLHCQTLKLQAQNAQLQQEIAERQQIEQALRHEQQKSEQLLLNILPEAIVEQLKHFQGSLAERFESATVMFADIVNFTPLAAEMSPLELVNLLNQIFSTFDRLAEKYQLEKIKTIGDAYMVVGGVPMPHDHHAAAVADMALEMQTVIQQFQRHNAAPLQLRIGINTGTVVAGVIGIRKFSYDLWGDTVNVASRMESQGIPGQIQVTEATYQQLRQHFRFAPGQELHIKGKGPMATYYLLGRR